MKKIRIKLSKKADWSFVIYDSSESAFYLKGEELDIEEHEEYCKIINLNSLSDILEIEWMGSEFLYEDEMKSNIFKNPSKMKLSTSDNFEKIRIAKFCSVKTKALKKGSGYIETAEGWVTAGTIPWNGPPSNRGDIKITRIKGRIKSKLDFSEIFKNQSENSDEDFISNKGNVVLN